MIHEFTNPIPVVTVDGDEAYAVYVRDGGTWENDVWCVALCEGGAIRHYRSDQLKLHRNETYNLTKHTRENRIHT